MMRREILDGFRRRIIQRFLNTEKENCLLADVCYPDELIKVQSYDYTLCVQVMICACAAKL